MEFDVVFQGFRSSNSLSSNAFDVEHQVDAKYPALLFKQQLAAYVEKIYGIIRESFKKDLSPPLSSCTKVCRLYFLSWSMSSFLCVASVLEIIYTIRISILGKVE